MAHINHDFSIATYKKKTGDIDFSFLFGGKTPFDIALNNYKHYERRKKEANEAFLSGAKAGVLTDDVLVFEKGNLKPVLQTNDLNDLDNIPQVRAFAQNQRIKEIDRDIDKIISKMGVNEDVDMRKRTPKIDALERQRLRVNEGKDLDVPRVLRDTLLTNQGIAAITDDFSIFDSRAYRGAMMYNDDPYGYIKDFRGNGLYRDELREFPIGDYIGPPDKIPDYKKLDPSFMAVGRESEVKPMAQTAFDRDASTFFTFHTPFREDTVVRVEELDSVIESDSLSDIDLSDDIDIETILAEIHTPTRGRSPSRSPVKSKPKPSREITPEPVKLRRSRKTESLMRKKVGPRNTLIKLGNEFSERILELKIEDTPQAHKEINMLKTRYARLQKQTLNNPRRSERLYGSKRTIPRSPTKGSKRGK